MADTVRLTALDGSPVEFVDRIIASGQKKDCYFSPDRRSVVLWYRDPVTEQDLARLQSITGVYRTQLFAGPAGDYWAGLMCWPQRIVRYRDRVGITAPAYQDRFFFEHGGRDNDALGLRGKEKEGYWFASLRHRTRSLDRRELGNWRTALRMAVRIARAIRRLHAAGLVHGDLSYRNVLLDPSRGDVCLIDLDGLVVPGKYPPEVIGTPDFIAPEVVATRGLDRADPLRRLPDWRADQHALAVLVYQMLLLRHPLRGDQIHDLDDDDRQEALLMGERALFIEHPERTDNRLLAEMTEAFEAPWKLTGALPYTVLGPHLVPLVERAFIHGLHDPALRPSAQEWEDALVASADLLHPCANAQCPAQWFIYDAHRHGCPFCGTALTAPVLVAHLYRDRGNGDFAAVGRQRVLHHHAAVHAWHLRHDLAPNEGLAPEQQLRQAYIAAHDGALYLVNETIDALRDPGCDAGATAADVAPGASVRLYRGQRLLFGAAPATQLWWIDAVGG